MRSKIGSLSYKVGDMQAKLNWRLQMGIKSFTGDTLQFLNPKRLPIIDLKGQVFRCFKAWVAHASPWQSEAA